MIDPSRGARARAGSPPPPTGEYDLTLHAEHPPVVVVDTSTLLDSDLRLPLRASAAAGDLLVYWSSSIAREFVKVVYRANVLAALRRAGASRPNLRQVFDDTARTLDEYLDHLESALRFPTHPRAVTPSLLDVMTDPDDRHVLSTALVVEAPYLLSLDQRHFPHGTVYIGVQCWHPDTFLTLFYQLNPDAYGRAQDRVRLTPDSLRRGLLP